MLSGATRKLKTLRRKRDRLPMGTIVDSSKQQTNGAENQNTVRGFSMDEKRGPSSDEYRHGGQMAPPGLGSHPSNSSGKASMTGSATQEDILVQRLRSWQSLAKEYIEYFESIAAVERSVSKALEKATGELAVPLKTDHCLAGIERASGVQQLGAQIREVHRMRASQHVRAAQSLETNTVKQLEALRSDIKGSLRMYTDHLAPIYKRLRKQAKDAEEAKEKLANAVEAYKKKHKAQDAWLAQQNVRRELTRQAEVENSLFTAVQAERERLARWEITVCERLRDIVAAAAICDRDCAQTNMAAVGACLGFMDHFDTTSEQRAFDAAYGSTLQAPLGLTGLASLGDYDYMHRDSAVAAVLLEGSLEREKGIIKNYHPTYAVLTAQGYLHCYAEQKGLLERAPNVSFHLIDCVVRPMDDPCVFQITAGGIKIGHSRHLFRAADAATADHWLNAIRSVSPAPESALPKSTVVGGTLRHSKAAEEAAAARAAATSADGLPTAAGITAGELAARNLSEDSARNKSEEAARDLSQETNGSVSHADRAMPESPAPVEKFYPAREVSDAPVDADGSPHSSNGTRLEDDTHLPRQMPEAPPLPQRGALPSYDHPADALDAPAAATGTPAPAAAH
ncbi:hypothetical protein H4S06_003990 [Coemansia sp. BCRC 34490]|nr:hypothetical protein H4S06_003990 [Coemansia sp. BCRC 34490]